MIESEIKEISCSECLNIIIHLYLLQSAIPFFKQDKLGFYNAAMNMYSKHLITNEITLSDFFVKVIKRN